jgi:RNA polymerase sigma-70 factor (ECF subfamily)
MELRDEIESHHAASFAWALACCAFVRADAEDVLQTVYLKVLDGRAHFDGRSAFRTWLFAVIRRTAADRRRRAFFATLGLERLWQRRVPTPHSDDGREHAAIRARLVRLPARQREVLELVFYHDLTVEEAAVVMQVSVGTARVHYERAKERLRHE